MLEFPQCLDVVVKNIHIDVKYQSNRDLFGLMETTMLSKAAEMDANAVIQVIDLKWGNYTLFF